MTADLNSNHGDYMKRKLTVYYLIEKKPLVLGGGIKSRLHGIFKWRSLQKVDANTMALTSPDLFVFRNSHWKTDLLTIATCLPLGLSEMCQNRSFVIRKAVSNHQSRG